MSQTEDKSTDLTQLESLMSIMINKQYKLVKHDLKQKISEMTHKDANAYIQAKTENILTLSLDKSTKLRREARALMTHEADFIGALEQYLMRGMIALEKHDVEQYPNPEQGRSHTNECLVKMLRLVYVCISLAPQFITKLEEAQSEKVLEVPALLESIAQEMM